MDFTNLIDQIYDGNGAEFKKYLATHTLELLNQLLLSLFQKEEIQIGPVFERKNKWSNVSMNPNDDNKDIGIRLHPDKTIELYFSFWNDQGLFDETAQKLTADQIQMIPAGLINLLQQVLDKEKVMTVNPNLLDRPGS